MRVNAGQWRVRRSSRHSESGDVRKAEGDVLVRGCIGYDGGRVHGGSPRRAEAHRAH